VELIGPYRLLRTLGVSDVGSVWSAFDAEGTSVTVAVIDSAHAGDAHWLGRFETATKALADSGELVVLHADCSPPRPWVACACAWDAGLGAGQVFLAQGMGYAVAPRAVRNLDEPAVIVTAPEHNLEPPATVGPAAGRTCG